VVQNCHLKTLDCSYSWSGSLYWWWYYNERLWTKTVSSKYGINECILGMTLAINGLDTYRLDDEYW